MAEAAKRYSRLAHETHSLNRDTWLPGYDDPSRGAAELTAAGVPCVVVKLGAEGALVARPGAAHVPVAAYPATAADPTGAGDSFCGVSWRRQREFGGLRWPQMSYQRWFIGPGMSLVDMPDQSLHRGQERAVNPDTPNGLSLSPA